MQRAKLALALLLGITVVDCASKPEGSGTIDGSIDGVVWVTGPVAGVSVSVFTLDVTTGDLGDSLASSDVTQADGHFHVTIGNYHGPLVLVASGNGSYVEPATGLSVSWDASTKLRSAYLESSPSHQLTFDFPLNEQVASFVISPFTDLAFGYAADRKQSGRSSTFHDALEQAVLLFEDHLEIPYWNTPPADLTAGASGGFQAGAEAGLELAGLSSLAARAASDSNQGPASVTSLAFLSLLQQDLSDSSGQLDGRHGADALKMGTCSTVCTLSSATLRGRWAESMATFLGSPLNKSGIGVTDAGDLLGRISNRTNELWPDPGSPTFDTQPPTITVDGLATAQVLMGSITATVTIQDNWKLGTSHVQLLRAGCDLADATASCHVTGLLSVVQKQKTDLVNVVELSLNTGLLTDGALTLHAEAVDDAGNHAPDVDIPLLSDNTPAGHVSGTVVLGGRVVGARVRVSEYDMGVKGAELGTTTTAMDGSYVVQVNDTTSSTLLLEVDNPPAGPAATYIEATSGATVAFSTSDVLHSVITRWKNGAERIDGTVSPWTEIATGLALARPAFSMTTWETAVEDAFGQLQSHFEEGGTVVDIRASTPTDLTDPSATFTLTAQFRYGLSLAALGQLADRHAKDSGVGPASVNTLTLTQFLEQDAGSHCLPESVKPCLDGRTGSGRLSEGMVLLDSYETRVNLAVAAVDFLETNPRNAATTIHELDVANFLDHVSTDANPFLYPDATCPASMPACGTEPPKPYDTIPPTVTFTAPSPADGAVVSGVITLEVSATDNRALDSLVWLTTAVGGPPRLDKTAGLAGPWILTGALDTSALPETAITVTAQATDQATNATPASRTFVVDRTPPVVTIATATAGGGTVASGGFTGAAMITITGTAADAHLAAASFQWGSPAGPAVMSGALTVAASGAWSISLPLAPGANTLTVAAVDRAGNAASPVTATYSRDATPPMVTVVTSIVLDESVVTPTISGAGAGTVSYAGPVSTVFLQAGATPSFTKFSSKYIPSDPNLPQWRFNVADDHSADSLIKFEVRLSQITGAAVVPLTGFTTVAPVAGGGFNRVQVISTALSPTVGQVSGTFVLDYRATDQFGNVSPLGSVRWDQTVKAPPLRQQANGGCNVLNGQCPQHYGLSTAFLSGGTPEGANTAHIPITGIGVPSGKLSLAEGEIDNPNPIPVRVNLNATVPTTFAVGDIWAEPQIADPTSVDLSCNDGLDPTAVGGGCFTAPSTTETRATGKVAGNLLTSIEVRDATSGAVLVPCPTCSSNEWEIPANTAVVVRLLGNPFAFLSAGFTGTIGAIASVGTVGALANVTGVTAGKWLECTAFHMFPDGVVRCTNQIEVQGVHYFTALRVAPTSSVSLLARPANDAATLSVPDGIGITAFAYSNSTWSTVEDKPGGGTFTSF